MPPGALAIIVQQSISPGAFQTGKIEIKSDGTPWRPVIHVARCVCGVCWQALRLPLVCSLPDPLNLGIPNGNFTVRELAEAAQRCVPGSGISFFTGQHGGDSALYKVGFTRVLTELKRLF